jgi:hypothetical protein
MKRRDLFVAVSLSAVTPVYADATPAEGYTIKITESQFKQACKSGLLTGKQCKAALANTKPTRDVAAPPPPPTPPTPPPALAATPSKTFDLPTLSESFGYQKEGEGPADCLSPYPPKAVFVRADSLDNFNYQDGDN